VNKPCSQIPQYSVVSQPLNIWCRVCHSQALLSLIDLQYHGSVLPADQGGSSSVWHQVAQQYSSIPPPPGICPQARFSHLTIYGASYYSYLYARCISEALWNTHLAADPLDPQAGEGWYRAMF
jgi:intermediate peptidase